MIHFTEGTFCFVKGFVIKIFCAGSSPRKGFGLWETFQDGVKFRGTKSWSSSCLPAMRPVLLFSSGEVTAHSQLCQFWALWLLTPAPLGFLLQKQVVFVALIFIYWGEKERERDWILSCYHQEGPLMDWTDTGIPSASQAKGKSHSLELWPQRGIQEQNTGPMRRQSREGK